MQRCGVHGEDGRVEPVGDWIGAEVNVVVCGGGTVDDHCAPETITVLDGIMGVIPLSCSARC
jgi:hypothetical protein